MLFWKSARLEKNRNLTLIEKKDYLISCCFECGLLWVKGFWNKFSVLKSTLGEYLQIIIDSVSAIFNLSFCLILPFVEISCAGIRSRDEFRWDLGIFILLMGIVWHIWFFSDFCSSIKYKSLLRMCVKYLIMLFCKTSLFCL